MGIKLLIATHNPGKLQELTQFFRPLLNTKIKIISLTDLKIFSEPEETGSTFEENSLLKAKYYAYIAKTPTIADDGGLTVNALRGEPGVKSRRWPGYAATDEELITYALKRLLIISPNRRSARMSTVITFFDPRTNTIFTEAAEVEGHLLDKVYSNWTRGYPYRALFVVDQFNKYYDELTAEEHDQINHRKIIVKRLAPKINNYLLQLKDTNANN